MTDKDVATARDIITMALRWQPERIEAHAVKSKAESKALGKRVRSRGHMVGLPAPHLDGYRPRTS